MAFVVPVAVWLLWRGQILATALLRSRLVLLARHAKWLYHGISWFGTLLHEASHATVLLLSGHGIKAFNVKSEQGHVTPRRQRKDPLSFLGFLAAALAPLFIPPAIVLGGLVWLVDRDLVPFAATGWGLRAAYDVLSPVVLQFPIDLLRAIVGLDLADWAHAIVFALVLLGAPGARPSHVKSKYHDGDGGDVAVIRRRIRRNPWPLIVFLLVLYGLYFALVPWLPAAYWYPFQAVWSVAVTGMVLAVGGAGVWSLVHETTRIRPALAWLAPVAFVAVQVLARLLAWPLVVWQINAASLGAWVAVAAVLRLVATRRP